MLRKWLDRVWAPLAVFDNLCSREDLFISGIIMAKARNEERDFWREFIIAYRDLPELWKVDSDDYKNRTKKDVAYQKLVEKFKEIDPRADRDVVRAKINILRTSYRREVKKVMDSIASGRGTDEVYIPKLWYFNDIDFLRDQEYQIHATSTMDGAENEERDETNDTVRFPRTPD